MDQTPARAAKYRKPQCRARITVPARTPNLLRPWTQRPGMHPICGMCARFWPPFAGQADRSRRSAEDQAERVTGGISEYPEALLMLGWEPPSAERQNRGFSGIDVVNPYVEVELLRIPGVWPARGNPFRRALKRKLACAGLTTDDHPVTGVLVYFHAQHAGVKRRERAGVRAVQHGLFQSADHLDSVSDGRRHTFGQRSCENVSAETSLM